MNSRILWIHALTPVHVGCGFGVGAVDLPITREKTSHWPYIPGSGIKGVMADHCGASNAAARNATATAAFGKPDWKDQQGQLQGSNAGALIFSDARLVAFPVRSLFGTWAWVTCPLALRRLVRDLQEAGLAGVLAGQIPAPGSNQLFVGNLQTKLKQVGQNQNRAFLADLDLEVAANEDTNAWAEKLAGWLFPAAGEQADPWAAEFKARFAVLHEDVFNYLIETATEVSTRIHIDPQTGVVAKGQLWAEEALPAESILASLVWVDRITAPGANQTAETILNTYCSRTVQLQIGGKATVGRGQARCVFTAPPAQ